ncbi:speckle targeted PIP5K1A-regulated poly(A) polymerase [Alligator mississippiensis]|uniref:polynucleotide adenylyltransferase n=1 Tax=Alligator mississippiensis TaxID=8496 RepID=A0A151M3Z1_ALLMI|nr:speckle targeted PIP5K1A-regulated poly(A) polymerase [Alligator mississippiensis]
MEPDVEALPRGGFRCRLCHVTAANRPSLDDHLRGRKHGRLAGLRAQRQAQAQRSVFVSGFRKGTDVAELSDYFQAFGGVASVVMDKDKGVYAIVELEDQAALEKVLAQPQHSVGGQRLRVKPREQKEFAYAPPKRQGGGRRELLSPEKLEQELCQAEDVDAQMRRLVQLFEFSEDERRLRHLLVTLFQEVFQEFLPGCSVLPFGSSINGFDVHGCDLDLFLDLEKTKTFQASAKGVPEAQCCEGAEPAAEDSILSDIDLGVAPEVLEVVRTVLQSCVPGVHRVQAVPSARRPVVKFSHKDSGLCGDISLNNRLGLCNTQFLQLCTEADERVRPLVYVLRYWAKQQGLAGNPHGGGPLFTNYALTLLVIFFLQTRSPPILPTVARLQQLAGDEERMVVDGWDCSFPRDAARLEPNTNTESLCVLLADFFREFGEQELSGHVISLCEGRVLPLEAVAGAGLRLGPVTLQDPFERSHNVAANVTERMAQRLRVCCTRAAKYCRSLQYQRKSAKGRPWGLVRLFQPEAGELDSDGLLLALPLAPAARRRELGLDPSSRQSWFGHVCAGVAFVLRDVLKCSCTELQRQPLGHAEQLLEPPGASLQQGETGEPPTSPAQQPAAPREPVDAPRELVDAPSAPGTPPAAGLKRPLSEEEGIPSPVSVSPARKRPRAEALEEAGAVSWSCALWHRVWVGRRRVRRQLRPQHSSPLAEAGTEQEAARSLELEEKVSAAIARQEASGEPLLQFTACARLDAQASLRFTPAPQHATLFQDFYHFLHSFLPTMLQRYLSRVGEASPEPGPVPRTELDLEPGPPRPVQPGAEADPQ